MAVVNRNASIEFVVKPKHDLYLEGPLRKLPRVAKGEAYPCQMQKNQNFSCLFRHYAKHNGLKKDDLVFSFVDELQADQSPETVHLMPQDEIWVEHRVAKEASTAKDSTSTASSLYVDQFYSMLESGCHSDVTFIAGEDKVEIRAHRAILCARSAYFEAMLGKEGMRESIEGVVHTMHEPAVFRRMLEFIYINTVRNIETLGGQDLINLIMLANEYLLDDLRALAEKAATRVISLETIGRLLLLSAGHNASALREACSEFVRENKYVLARDPAFRQDIELNPELGILLFESSLPKLPVIEGEESVSSTCAIAGEVGNKRRRIMDQNSENEGETATLLPPTAAPTLTVPTTAPTVPLAASYVGQPHAYLHAPMVAATTSTTTSMAAAPMHAPMHYPAGGIMGTVATTAAAADMTSDLPAGNNTIG